MMTVAIVEDDAVQGTQIERLVQAFARDRSIPLTTLRFEDGEQIAGGVTADIDLILMDIQMQRMDGMTAAMHIRKRNPNVLIIFITSMAQYAVQGYQVEALDFLVKPVTALALSASMERALRRIEQRRPACIRVRSGTAQHIIDTRQILFVEAQDHRALIRTQAGSLPCSATLSSLETQLLPHGFFRCHSAFLVSLAHVERVDACDALIGGVRVPVSKHRRKAFLSALTLYWGKQL